MEFNSDVFFHFVENVHSREESERYIETELGTTGTHREMGKKGCWRRWENGARIAHEYVNSLIPQKFDFFPFYRWQILTIFFYDLWICMMSQDCWLVSIVTHFPFKWISGSVFVRIWLNMEIFRLNKQPIFMGDFWIFWYISQRLAT